MTPGELLAGEEAPHDESRDGRPLASATPAHVVVVGAGFAGLEVARGLCRAAVRLTIIDRAEHHVFQPLLYQVATAQLAPSEISAPIRGILRRQANATVVCGEVTGVDPRARQVMVRDPSGGGARAIGYDYLVLASGASQSDLGRADADGHPLGLKTLGDTLALRDHLLRAAALAAGEPDEGARRALRTVVIIGGGPTGVELAGALVGQAPHVSAGAARDGAARDGAARDGAARNGAAAEPPRVVLFEARARILPSFSARLARRAAARLGRLGVEVRTGTAVERITAAGVVAGGEALPAHTVVSAVGTRPSAAAQWVGAASDRTGHAIVQDDLTPRDHPEIFIIGDTANVACRGASLPPIAPVALREGRYVAVAIRRRIAGLPVPSFSCHERGMLTPIGRGYAIADVGGLPLWGSLAWLLWAGVHIFFLIGFRNRLLVMARWAAAARRARRSGR